MQSNMTFHRFEKKYLLTPRQAQRLEQRLPEHMAQDAHGQYTIASVYFDTDAYDIIRTSVQKPLFKEKLRLRWYGDAPQDTLFLELKRKYRGLVYKRRIAIDQGCARRLLQQSAVLPAQGQIAGEMAWFIARHRPVPKLLLSYNRQALQGREDETLRITFDRDIRWRDTNLDLAHGSYGAPLLMQRRVLMEIKAPQTLPVWLANMLAAEKIYPSSFSKYGTWYQQIHLQKGCTQHVG